MMQAAVRFAFLGSVIVAAQGLSSAAIAQPKQQAVERQAPPAPAPATQAATVTVAQDARETRQDFEAVLRKLPPSVARVLRLDHSLMRNQSYLAPYPELAGFLALHPDVVHNPAYYLENVHLDMWYPQPPRDARSELINMWRNMIEGVAMVIVFLTITAALLWIVRSVLEYRRWYRTSRVQTEVHAKLLERFTSNEDLLAYIQSPVGQRFLETAPLPVEAPARPVGAPFTRIFWSVQAGMVLAAAGLGLLFVSTRVIEEMSQVFFAVGVLALAIGVGFAVSAVVSLLLSQRLGLLGAGKAREHSGPTSA
jgi:hypothetical protein